jgi:primosomal protein N' (replication factor Y) (superfamily II helicase)
MKKMYAEVLIEYQTKSLDRAFTYIVPDNLINTIRVGMHVSIPFNNRVINGFVINLFDNYNKEYELKSIISIIDEDIVLNDELLSVAKYIHNKTLSPLISSIQAMYPSSLKIKDKHHNYYKYDIYIKLNKDKLDLIDNLKGIKQREIINVLKEKDMVLKSEYPISTIKNLLDKNIIVEVKKEKYRINEICNKELKKDILNEEQVKVYNEIINSSGYNTFLLEGVTGSGKTLVYLNLVEYMIKNKKTSLILVPEISLTMQIVRKFYEYFGSSVAIFHSALSEGEKQDEYLKILRGEVSVVVGTRSSVFAPLKNLGIIIVDECHSDTYKQDSLPRYNALDIANFRSKYNNIPVVFGSATPRLEERARALKGVYKYLKITKRANNLALPNTVLVNMTEEVKKGNYYFSVELINNIKEVLNKKEQVILLLNRRGFSTTITCRNCGYTYKCKNCDITLTYHKSSNNLRCHYCGYTKPLDKLCPKCNEDGLNYLGFGTEKLEVELNNILPNARIIRMDQDTTTKKGSHDKIITSFKNYEYDILLGTQMISKGLDFPKVTLVGVINADYSLNIPDFRSNEKTYELLSQVSGRAGRSKLAGKVIIQTYNPDNEILKFVKDNNFDGFYKYEMNLRRLLKYPPYYYLASIRVTSKDYKKASIEAINVSKYLKNNIDSTSIVLGPTTHNVFKYNNVYRFVIVVKYRFDNKLNNTLKEIDKEYMYNNDINIEIDIDPINI